MAKKALLTIDGTYRKIKKGFITVDTTYRRIKKAYITVGGIWRPCWSGGEVTYYGTATPLSEGRGRLTATTVGNYALFGGGYRPSKYVENYTSTDASNVVDAYDTSLTRTTAPNLPYECYWLSSTTVGNYALFGGGYYNETIYHNAYEYSNYERTSYYVTAYDYNLTTQNASSFTCDRHSLAATAVGNYALFGGGFCAEIAIYGVKSNVDVYDNSLTHTQLNLSVARAGLAATTVGNYALFGGGGDYNSISYVVDVFDASLVHTTADALTYSSNLSNYNINMKSVTVGDYALFYSGNNEAIVEVYDSNLTKTTIILSTPRSYKPTVNLKGYALFGGASSVDIFDTSLTRRTLSDTGIADNSAATAVGDYALFGGGDTEVTTVNVFTV